MNSSGISKEIIQQIRLI